MREPEKVRVRDCECPGKPHNGEGDWVLLAPTLSLEGGLAAEQDLRDINTEFSDAERGQVIQRRWVVTFLRYGLRGWNLLDDDGEPLPFDLQQVLDDYGFARPIADRAADLYSDAVLRPFLTRLQTRSPTGPTTVTTSKARRRTRGRSGPSSPATTAGSTPSTP